MVKEVQMKYYAAGKYMFKVNNRNTIARCEICSRLKIRKPERRHCRRSGVFIVNFGHIARLALVFLLSTLHSLLKLWIPQYFETTIFRFQ